MNRSKSKSKFVTEAFNIAQNDIIFPNMRYFHLLLGTNYEYDNHVMHVTVSEAFEM